MKRNFLLEISALTLLSMKAMCPAMAQTPFKENIAVNIGGTRFVVNAPASITGIKKINYATWSAAATPPISNAVVEKAYDTLGTNPLLNGTGSYPSLTGKFALIYRGGGVSFSQKANYCKAAGAIGVIIVNNVSGDPVGMAATPTGSTVSIPVIMVSDVDGAAINDAIRTSAAGTVKVTLGTWNTGGTHDLGIMTAYQAGPHAVNIPLSQLTGSAGTTAFKHYIGGAIANYGTSAETAVTVTDSVFWTPSSSTTESYVHSHSYTVPSITVGDSIKFGFGSGSYELTPPTTNGKYTHRYRTSYANTDDFPQDNVFSAYQYVNDSIYCKGGYDYINGRPNYTLGIRPRTTTTATTDFVMGNLMYVKNGGYAARKAQFYLSHETNPTLSPYGTVAYLLKWTDGVNAPGKTGAVKDSIVAVSELNLVAAGGKSFTTADTSGRVINIDLIDPFGGTGAIILEDNSWYFLAVDVPADLFIGVDENQSFFPRAYAQYINGGAILNSSIEETAGGIGIVTSSTTGFSNYADFGADDNNYVGPFPFSGSLMTIDSAYFDRYNEVPAIAFLISKGKVTGINEVTKSIGVTTIYPNPSIDGKITVDVSLKDMNGHVTYNIVDMTGRSVYKETHNNVQKEKFDISVKNVPSGNYVFMVIGENGIQSQKLIVQH